MFKVILSIVQTVIVLCLVGVVIVSFAYKLPVLNRLGLTFYNVTSGSMEPTIPTGSLIYSGKFDPNALSKGDIITFTRTDSGGKSTVVTHRIEEVKKADLVLVGPDKKEQRMTKISYVTKGDANGSPDQEEVLPNQILGKYKWGIPKLGYVAIFAQTQAGFLLLVVLPALVLVIWELLSVINHFRGKYKKKSEEEVEKLKKELEKTKKKVEKAAKEKYE
jgi:signal peptidase